MTITDGKNHRSPDACEEEELAALNDKTKQLLLSLPKAKGWRTSNLYFFQNFWCQAAEIQAVTNFQNHFQANDDDVFLATIPKSGTTWLKALAFTILNRERHVVNAKTNHHHPLLTSNPHDLVPFLEYKLYENNRIPDFSDFLEQPRIFGTHVPFHALANSIKKSNAKIVYICRNPLDTFVSSWHFVTKLRSKSLSDFSLEEAFEMYCNGVVGWGPFWDHMLGYWKESKERPEKVLFLKYEDMKSDLASNINKLAKFLGCPFSVEEERDGVIEEIAELCSFEKMKELDVNKNGRSIKNFENKNLFRNGVVGDWVNYLSPEMVKRLSEVMVEKLFVSGLTFQVFI